MCIKILGSSGFNKEFWCFHITHVKIMVSFLVFSSLWLQNVLISWLIFNVVWVQHQEAQHSWFMTAVMAQTS